MSGEYELARKHWIAELQRMIEIGFGDATFEQARELDSQFETCMMIYQHMRQQQHTATRLP